MLLKVTKGSDPNGLCQYVLDTHKLRPNDPPILATNMAGTNAEELAKEFNWIIDRPRKRPVKQTMAHYSASLAEGEQITPTKMALISQRLLHEMSHSTCPFFAVQHHDQEHKRQVHHWHIVTSTIGADGRWVPDHFSRLQLKKLARNLEQQFGLTECPEPSPAEQRTLTTGEARLKARTGEILPKEKLWSAIAEATADKPTLPLLVARLKAQDIQVRLRQQDNTFSGISFETDGIAFAGYQLGPSFSLGGLQHHRQVFYEPTSHDGALRELLDASPDACRQHLKDHDETQHQLHQRYQLYAGAGEGMQGERLDRLVSTRAITNTEDPEQIIQILRQGVMAQRLQIEQGHAAMLNYCQQMVVQARALAQGPGQTSPQMEI